MRVINNHYIYFSIRWHCLVIFEGILKILKIIFIKIRDCTIEYKQFCTLHTSTGINITILLLLPWVSTIQYSHYSHEDQQYNTLNTHRSINNTILWLLHGVSTIPILTTPKSINNTILSLLLGVSTIPYSHYTLD